MYIKYTKYNFLFISVLSCDINLFSFHLISGENLPDDKIREMITSVDRDGDGEVDFQEFCHLLEADS